MNQVRTQGIDRFNGRPIRRRRRGDRPLTKFFLPSDGLLNALDLSREASKSSITSLTPRHPTVGPVFSSEADAKAPRLTGPRPPKAAVVKHGELCLGHGLLSGKAGAANGKIGIRRSSLTWGGGGVSRKTRSCCTTSMARSFPGRCLGGRRFTQSHAGMLSKGGYERLF